MNRCPPKEELVLLLGAEPSPHALRRHVDGCAACQKELAPLRAAYQALDPAFALAADPATLARIEAGARARLAAPAGPAPRRLLAGALLATLLTLVALGLWLAVLGHDLAARRGLLLALWPGALLLGLRLPPRPQALLLGGALGGGALLALWDTAGVVVPLLRGLPCLGRAASGALLPALSLGWFAGDGRRSLAGGALLGAAAFSAGLAVQTALCDLGRLAHVAALHLGPLLLGTALFALAGGRTARPSPAGAA